MNPNSPLPDFITRARRDEMVSPDFFVLAIIFEPKGWGHEEWKRGEQEIEKLKRRIIFALKTRVRAHLTALGRGVPEPVESLGRRFLLSSSILLIRYFIIHNGYRPEQCFHCATPSVYTHILLVIDGY